MPTINRTCQANLVIVSDHGFTTFDYKVHLNRWLIERGYLVPRKNSETGSLKEIDWAASKAYAVGLNSLYLNLEGRENQGCVSAKDRDSITLRIGDELMAWRGPNGRPVIQEVYARADTFSGHLSELSPDFIIGYANGFRASAETGLGWWKSASMEENHDHWNGDHCVDPHVVPGVIFCNQGLSNFPAPTFRPKFLGTAKKILGLATDAPQLSAADVIRAYDKRWTVEQWLKDVKQLLGLGQYQNRSYWAAVTHLHLVCFAYALLTHLRIERTGAQGQRTRHKAADLSTAAAQDQLRSLLWEDLVTYLQAECPDQPVIEELERLRVA